ncbi:MAG: SIMPL domain-containing protein [Anaerolineales bacterium]
MYRSRMGLSAWVGRALGLAVAASAMAGLSLVLSGCSALGVTGEPRTISVTGIGTVHLPPDVVRVNLGVQTRGADISEAVRENNTLAEAVTAAVKAAGVAEDDIQTTYFNVYSQPQYDEFGNPTGDVTYWVDNTVTVALRQVDALGDLLQKALNAGANSVQGVTYSVDDPEAALAGARTEALEDARRQAEQLASGAGATVGPILSLTETSSGGASYPSDFDKGAAGVPTEPGTLEYQISVYVTYTLR